MKYYLYYLEKKGVSGLSGKIDYPLLRETVSVELNKEDYQNIENAISYIKEIYIMPTPPVVCKKGICKQCAYHDLCFI